MSFSFSLERVERRERRGKDRLGVQYARMVCSQLIQTPLKEKSTPPSLSLYLDVAIMEGLTDQKCMGESNWNQDTRKGNTDDREEQQEW